ncbi:MAG TPA: BMP family ABC transporter substrate-binding protein [Peptococcaceae bacterium]|nr:BMP family ABC transporter substrate-binding protein [Peptococcaceae bacterium]
MKRIKKIMALWMVLVMAFSLAACGTKPAATTTTTTAPATTTPAAEEGKYELALITDIGTIDDKSFNQGAWEGLKKYAEEKGITHKYYKPTEKSTDAYVAAIDLAVQGGAKLIVTPGFLFEPAIYKAQDAHPDVSFILLDGAPHPGDYNIRIEKNVYSVFYAEQQAGFLAGYAAVKDGYKNIGFLGGMAVPAVIRFGYGFVQGADYAAVELGMKSGDINLMYKYTGDFAATPENQTLAASWYKGGTEVIFAAGGAVGNSVMAAAEQSGTKVIGVDVDQSPESPTVISSAMKMLGVSVYDGIAAFYGGTFPGGKSVSLDVNTDGVGLPMATSKWQKFSQADYDAIYDKLVKDTDGLASTMKNDTSVKAATEIPTKVVKITVVE